MCFSFRLGKRSLLILLSRRAIRLIFLGLLLGGRRVLPRINLSFFEVGQGFEDIRPFEGRSLDEADRKVQCSGTNAMTTATIFSVLLFVRSDALVVPEAPRLALSSRRRHRTLLHAIPEDFNYYSENWDEECVVPSEAEMTASFRSMMRETRMFDSALILAPIVVPIGAFLCYETVARYTRMTLDILGQRNTWVAVDGNAYQIAILAPVVNGVVVPAVSIALGTSVATTVSTLRQRQVDIRNLLNAELCAISNLRSAIAALEDGDHGRARQEMTSLLRDYVSRLISEATAGFQPDAARIADNELNRLSSVLFSIDSSKRRVQNAATAARQSVAVLQDVRSERLAKLAATYPSLHYVVLALCGLSIIAAFLLESDQEILRFLDAIQLRLLFAILVGAFAGLSTLLLDLADLHRGTLRITPIAAQFFLTRDYLTFDLCQLSDNDQVVPLILATPPPSETNQTLFDDS